VPRILRRYFANRLPQAGKPASQMARQPEGMTTGQLACQKAGRHVGQTARQPDGWSSCRPGSRLARRLASMMACQPVSRLDGKLACRQKI